MQTAFDPVCGKEIDSDYAAWLLLYSDYHRGQQRASLYEQIDGSAQRYYFCSTACKVMFDSAPGYYSGPIEGPYLFGQPEPGWY